MQHGSNLQKQDLTATLDFLLVAFFETSTLSPSAQCALQMNQHGVRVALRNLWRVKKEPHHDPYRGP